LGSRRYLRDEYDTLPNLSEKRDFLHSLANLATFTRTAWGIGLDEVPTFDPFEIKDDDVLLCFDALRDLKHNITLAPLVPFFDEAQRALGEERPKRVAELRRKVAELARNSATFQRLTFAFGRIASFETPTGATVVFIRPRTGPPGSSTKGAGSAFPLLHPEQSGSRQGPHIYLFLAAKGWEATLARYRKPKAVSPPENNQEQCTVGDFSDGGDMRISNSPQFSDY
jgi:hypothetical protein